MYLLFIDHNNGLLEFFKIDLIGYAVSYEVAIMAINAEYKVISNT